MHVYCLLYAACVENVCRLDTNYCFQLYLSSITIWLISRLKYRHIKFIQICIYLKIMSAFRV